MSALPGVYPYAVKQSAGRWTARVVAVAVAGLTSVWDGDRIHRTRRAAYSEAVDKAKELRETT